MQHIHHRSFLSFCTCPGVINLLSKWQRETFKWLNNSTCEYSRGQTIYAQSNNLRLHTYGVKHSGQTRTMTHVVTSSTQEHRRCRKTLLLLILGITVVMVTLVYRANVLLKRNLTSWVKSHGELHSNTTDEYRGTNSSSQPLRQWFSEQMKEKLDRDHVIGFTGSLKPHRMRVVPNVAHYIWFSCHPFLFENLVSIISVYKIMKAETIFFHTDCEPSGEFWEETIHITNLVVVHRQPPVSVFNKSINPEWPEHQSDVARLQILMKFGGIYLDTDIFILKSLEPLRYYDYVVGRQSSCCLNNGIILASNNSEFLRIFYENYRTYNARCYSCMSIKKHNEIAKQHQDLVHVESYSLVQPNFDRWKTIFYGKFNWQENHYSVHLWMKQFKQKNKSTVFTRESVKKMDSAFGQMCRYIYYGTSDCIEHNTTVMPWWN
ncbi:uncharacterized protein LOC144342563 [Saccoglossus kowalevskii]